MLKISYFQTTFSTKYVRSAIPYQPIMVLLKYKALSYLLNVNLECELTNVVKYK